MAIPMTNTLDNSSREYAQRLYNKNVELESKCRKAAQAKIPSDPNAWQQMRENYESILLEDQIFSEQHDIEYALWQLHYKRIEELRAHYNATQGPARPGPDRLTKIRSQFKTFLSEATGFYHDLMVKIRAKYGFSLGYMSDGLQNDVDFYKDGNKSIDVKKGLISCHRCLIYLGDLARYKGLYGEGDSKTRDFTAASSYYKQAATLWPSSGNPHHQLAILASYSGDELLAVYRYFRSLAVDTPFTTARDNLIIAFEKNRQSYCQLLGDLKAAPNKKLPARMTGKGRNKGETRLSLKDRKPESTLVENREPTVPETLKAFSIRFIRLNGILFTRTSLETFGEVLSVTRTDFLQLLSSGQDDVLNFGSDFSDCKLFITRFISIMIFTVYNVNKETENKSYAEILQRSVVLQNVFSAIFDFMTLIVDRCFQLNEPSRSFLLPGIMIFVEWLVCCQDVAVINETEEKQSLFMNRFVLFLNKILSSGSYVVSEKTNRIALPEDVELRGFLPLVNVHIVLDFSRVNYLDENRETNARVQRILAAGKALSMCVRVGQKGIFFDSKSRRFLFGLEPHNTDEEEDEVIVFKPNVSEKRILPKVDFIENGISNLDLSGNGFPTSSGMFQSDGFGASNEQSFQDLETMIPSKFDTVMTSAPGFDTISSNTKFTKSPVSRPVRHLGPPPGFNTASPKFTNEPLLGVNIRNENPCLDDYSWLDGYQLPQPNKLLNTNKSCLGMESFSFPGKQVSNIGIGNQYGNGNGNGWVDYQIPQHSSNLKETTNILSHCLSNIKYNRCGKVVSLCEMILEHRCISTFFCLIVIKNYDSCYLLLDC